MKIEVHVKPNARKEIVERLESGIYKVSVNAPAQEGRANEAVIRILSEHFDVPKSAIAILRGDRGRKKLVEIAGLPALLE